MIWLLLVAKALTLAIAALVSVGGSAADIPGNAYPVTAVGSHVGMEWRCHHGRQLCFAGRVYLGEYSWYLVRL